MVSLYFICVCVWGRMRFGVMFVHTKANTKHSLKTATIVWWIHPKVNKKNTLWMRLVRAPFSMGFGKSVIMECGEYSAEWTGMDSNRKLYVILNSTFCRIICLSFSLCLPTIYTAELASRVCMCREKSETSGKRIFVEFTVFLCALRFFFFLVQTNGKRETMWLSTQTNESLGTKKGGQNEIKWGEQRRQCLFKWN